MQTIVFLVAVAVLLLVILGTLMAYEAERERRQDAERALAAWRAGEPVPGGMIAPPSAFDPLDIAGAAAIVAKNGAFNHAGHTTASLELLRRRIADSNLPPMELPPRRQGVPEDATRQRPTHGRIGLVDNA